MREAPSRERVEALQQLLSADGISYRDLKERAMAFSIGIGDWCTLSPTNRFQSYRVSDGAANVAERIAMIGRIKDLTGCVSGITMNSYATLSEYGSSRIPQLHDDLRRRDLTVYSVQPNSVRDSDYALGSLTARASAVQEKFLRHTEATLKVAESLEAPVLSLWFADGTNNPGQDDFRRRKRSLQRGLEKIHEMLPSAMEMHIEYKLFEPATYHSDIADWGMAYVYARHVGSRAKVLMDIGHHPLGANMEHTAAFLLDENMLGSLHVNSKKYADDDLSVGSINPYEIFLVLAEMVRHDPQLSNAPHITLDEFHFAKPPLVGITQSVLWTQELMVKALATNWELIEKYQAEGDYGRSEMTLQRGFFRDVTPLLEELRLERNAPLSPLDALSD